MLRSRCARQVVHYDFRPDKSGTGISDSRAVAAVTSLTRKRTGSSTFYLIQSLISFAIIVPLSASLPSRCRVAFTTGSLCAIKTGRFSFEVPQFLFSSRLSAAFLFELGEGSDVVLRGVLSEPVEVGFPVRSALMGWRRPCDVPNCSAVAPEFETLSALDRVEHAGRLTIQLAHGQHFHVRQDKPDTSFGRGRFWGGATPMRSFLRLIMTCDRSFVLPQWLFEHALKHHEPFLGLVALPDASDHFKLLAPHDQALNRVCWIDRAR